MVRPGYLVLAPVLLFALFHRPDSLAFAPAAALRRLIRGAPRPALAGAEDPLKDAATKINGAPLPVEMLEPPKANISKLPDAASAKEAFKAEVKKAKSATPPAASGGAATKEDELKLPDVKLPDISLPEGLPSWVPVAALGSALVGVLIFAVISLTNATAPRVVRPGAAKPAPAPVVVQVREPAPVAPAAKPAPAVVAPVPKAAPKAAPAPAPPAAAPAAAAPGSTWGKRFANFLASGLIRAAEELPAAEQALEKEMPEVEKGVKWALEIRPENAAKKAEEAMPVVGKTVAKGAEVAARSGLKFGATVLDFAKQELPEVGQVAQGAAVKVLPGLQSVTRAVAGEAREIGDEAGKFSKAKFPKKVSQDFQKAVGKVEPVLDTTAAALDVAADAAPGAEALANYAAGKALPVVQAALSAFSEVVSDASQLPAPEKVPLPEASQVKGTLKELGLDADALGAAAAKEAQGAWSSAVKSVPSPGDWLSNAWQKWLEEPEPAPKPAPKPKPPSPAPKPAAAAPAAPKAAAPVAAPAKAPAPAPAPAPVKVVTSAPAVSKS